MVVNNKTCWSLLGCRSQTRSRGCRREDGTRRRHRRSSEWSAVEWSGVEWSGVRRREGNACDDTERWMLVPDRATGDMMLGVDGDELHQSVFQNLTTDHHARDPRPPVRPRDIFCCMQSYCNYITTVTTTILLVVAPLANEALRPFRPAPACAVSRTCQPERNAPPPPLPLT